MTEPTVTGKLRGPMGQEYPSTDFEHIDLWTWLASTCRSAWVADGYLRRVRALTWQPVKPPFAYLDV